jgi:DNA-binding NtrC family response regulator
MPARIVVVHDDPEFVDLLTIGLSLAGHDIATYPDPVAAWDALSAPKLTKVLITRVQFEPGRSNGVALANMAKSKSREISVLFTALPKFREEAEQLGMFLPMSASAPDVIAAVEGLLEGQKKI